MTVRREVAVSAGLSVAAVVAIGCTGFLAARSVATEEALRQAEQATEMLARAVIEPAISKDLLDGDPRAIDELDAAVQTGILGDQILTVRVWAADGTILYTDDLTGIGQRFPLGAEEQEVLATGVPHASLSDLEKDENAEQTDYEQLLEVYAGVQGPDGAPLLFETYQSPDPIAATTSRILAAFMPVVLGGLLVFGLVQALLAWRLARRLERAQDERERLLQQTLTASEHERRTIAADLHDGVVQDLVGLTYTLDALAVDPGDPERGADLTSASATTRRSVRSLRSLLVEIYPPNLDQVGLAGALADLVAGAGSAGIAVDVHVDPSLDLPPSTRAAIYRTVREALSNVRRHSRASRATVRVDPNPSGGVTASVTDDGIGFDPGDVATGHVGLRLLGDLAATVGGTLVVDAAPGRGTAVRLEVP